MRPHPPLLVELLELNVCWGRGSFSSVALPPALKGLQSQLNSMSPGGAEGWGDDISRRNISLEEGFQQETKRGDGGGTKKR